MPIMSFEATDPLMMGANGMADVDLDDANAMDNLELNYDQQQHNEGGYDFDELHMPPEAVLSQPLPYHNNHDETQNNHDNHDNNTNTDMNDPMNDAASQQLSQKTNILTANNQSPMKSPFQAPGVTKVDGLGLWRSFTRNFKTPVHACLDLLDNSLDATLSSPNNSNKDDPFQGKVTIERLPQHGLVITNNSYKPIKPLDQVLGVFQSSKGTHEGSDGNAKADAIGENGVGLKQGCATLSDTSFCLTRNKNVFQLGVIAYQLQTNEGCCLPSFNFVIDQEDDKTPEDIEQEITSCVTLVVTENPKIRQIVADDLGGGHVHSGVVRLVRNFLILWNDEWEQYDYCFRLIVVKLKHTQSTSEHEGLTTRSNNGEDPVVAFMDELKEVLPRQYINIPFKDFSFSIAGQKLHFSYWQRRLVELTRFRVHIPMKTRVADFQLHDWDKQGYRLSVYCGFDPLRVEDPEGQKTLALYIYSRSSGRLIRHWPDGRGLLGLANTGSDFSQGLTVLVDDVNGMLPLNPTKQDIAWSEQTQAKAHEQNFYDWVAAVASLYWNYHADRFHLIGGRKKTKLTEAVTEFADPVRRHIHDQENLERRTQGVPEQAVAAMHGGSEVPAPTQLHRLEHAELTTFEPISWRKYGSTARGRKITLRAEKQSLQPTPGRETLFRWTDENYRQYDREDDVVTAPRKRKSAPVDGQVAIERASEFERMVQQRVNAAAGQIYNGHRNNEHQIPLPNMNMPPLQGRQQMQFAQLQAQQHHNIALIEHQSRQVREQQKLLMEQQNKILEHERRQQEYERKQKLLQQQEQFGNDSLFAEMFPNDVANDDTTKNADNSDDGKPVAICKQEPGLPSANQQADPNDDSDGSEIVFVGYGHDGKLEQEAPRKQTARKSTKGKAPSMIRPPPAAAANPNGNDAALASVLNAEVERLKKALEEQKQLAASARQELDGCKKDLDDAKDDLEGAKQEKVLLEKQLEHAKKATQLKNEQEVENLKIEKDDLKFQLLEAQRAIRKQERELRKYRLQEEKAGGGSNGLVNGYSDLSQESV